jgi:hypothetical protein
MCDCNFLELINKPPFSGFFPEQFQVTPVDITAEATVEIELEIDNESACCEILGEMLRYLMELMSLGDEKTPEEEREREKFWENFHNENCKKWVTGIRDHLQENSVDDDWRKVTSNSPTHLAAQLRIYEACLEGEVLDWMEELDFSEFDYSIARYYGKRP